MLNLHESSSKYILLSSHLVVYCNLGFSRAGQKNNFCLRIIRNSQLFCSSQSSSCFPSKVTQLVSLVSSLMLVFGVMLIMFLLLPQ